MRVVLYWVISFVLWGFMAAGQQAAYAQTLSDYVTQDSVPSWVEFQSVPDKETRFQKMVVTFIILLIGNSVLPKHKMSVIGIMLLP